MPALHSGNAKNKQIAESSPVPPKVNLFDQRTIQLQRFSYNAHYFYWSVGDEVNLKDVFSGPITLVGGVTYEFRRKALFIFVKSATANTLKHETVYELPANTEYQQDGAGAMQNLQSERRNALYQQTDSQTAERIPTRCTQGRIQDTDRLLQNYIAFVFSS